MASFLLSKKSKKSFLEAISILKYSTRENYFASLHRFDKYCKTKYDGRNSEEVIQEIKSLSNEERDEAFFGVLQGFVNWLMQQNLANTTVNQYCQIIIYYFSHHGIHVSSLDIRHNIKRPRKIKEKLHPLTKEEILRLFNFVPEKRIMLYLTLIGSGMRIREIVALRKKDFDLNYTRIKIEIPAPFTKSQTQHTTFVSKEAEKLLRPYLESLNSDDLVFATNVNPYHAAMTEIEAFTRYRKRAGLIQKYESTKRHYISLHSFRSYFFTRARRVHDTDIAHAMVGHTTYLDMYDRKDDNEKLELYLQVEPLLKIRK